MDYVSVGTTVNKYFTIVLRLLLTQRFYTKDRIQKMVDFFGPTVYPDV